MLTRTIGVFTVMAVAAVCRGAGTPTTRPAEKILGDAAAYASWPYRGSSFKSHVRWTKDFGRVTGATIDAQHFYAADGKERVESLMNVMRNDVLKPPKPDNWISIITGEKYVYYRQMPQGQKTYVHYGDTKERVERWKRGMRSDMGSGGFLNGGIDGQVVSVFDLARTAGDRLQLSHDKINEIDCDLLQCDLSEGPAFPLTSGKGHLRMWVAESLGYCLLAYQIDGHGVIGNKEADLKIHFGNVKTVKLRDHVVVAAGKYETSLTNGAGVETTTADGERTEIKIFDEQFTFAGIVDGSPASIDGKSGGYIWSEGKPVPEMKIDIPQLLPVKKR